MSSTTSRARFDPRSWLLALVCAAVSTIAAIVLITESREDVVGILYQVLSGPSFVIVGSLILARRPRHRIGRLMLTMGLFLALPMIVNVSLPAIGVDSGSIPALVAAEPIFQILQSVTISSGGLLLLVWFPSGHRSTRIGALIELLAVIFVGIAVVDVVAPSVAGDLDESLFILVIAGYLLAVTDLLLRYRRSDRVARAQIRWVAASAMITIALIGATVVFGEQFEGLWGMWIVSTVLPAFAVGIAITRYRLYDIDRIISNAVGYGLVSLVLLAVFWIVNLALQAALRQVTGGGPLVVAVTTLVVAALFNPVRIRIQGIVDRRFHRAHYDAERLVTSFAGRLRDQLDLDHLAMELTDTSTLAVQPAIAGVWYRPRTRPR